MLIHHKVKSNSQFALEIFYDEKLSNLIDQEIFGTTTKGYGFLHTCSSTKVRKSLNVSL